MDGRCESLATPHALDRVVFGALPALTSCLRTRALLARVVAAVQAHGRERRCRRPPRQRRQPGARCIQPRRLARAVPIVPLLNMTGPSAAQIGHDPPACGRWRGQSVVRPRVRRSRMLENTAEPTHGIKRSGEASAVVSLLKSNLDARTTEPVTPPPLARWMRDDRVRAVIKARVAVLVPRVDAIKAEVAATRGDIESGDHRGTFTFFRSW